MKNAATYFTAILQKTLIEGDKEDFNRTPLPQKAHRLKWLIVIPTISLIGCGGGDSDSGGGMELTREILRCVSVVNTTVTNNCSFAANIRYFTAENLSNTTEAIRLLQPGEAFDVAPFDSQTRSGVPSCQAPLTPSQIFQATSITCEG